MHDLKSLRRLDSHPEFIKSVTWDKHDIVTKTHVAHIWVLHMHAHEGVAKKFLGSLKNGETTLDRT